MISLETVAGSLGCWTDGGSIAATVVDIMYPNLMPLGDNIDNMVQLLIKSSPNVVSSMVVCIGISAAADFHSTTFAKHHCNAIDKLLQWSLDIPIMIAVRTFHWSSILHGCTDRFCVFFGSAAAVCACFSFQHCFDWVDHHLLRYFLSAKWDICLMWLKLSRTLTCCNRVWVTWMGFDGYGSGWKTHVDPRVPIWVSHPRATMKI